MYSFIEDHAPDLLNIKPCQIMIWAKAISISDTKNSLLTP